MPVLGFLGFPPFAVECWAIYIFVRSLLQTGVRERSTDEIFLSACDVCQKPDRRDVNIQTS
jgi:hypothetical protein